MHMADALLSPVVGGSLWAGTIGAIIYSARKLKVQMDEQMIPLMGVLGAFIFAGQMINFTVPGTGSSGHIGGGMLLAILLGPYAAFLVITSVLMVQALFFADGGLLALGANIWNLGTYPCFIAYPLIYRTIVRQKMSHRRITIAAILSVVIGLQFGALSVVLETKMSGITELPFSTFLLLMQPIHLAIGLIGLQAFPPCYGSLGRGGSGSSWRWSTRGFSTGGRGRFGSNYSGDFDSYGCLGYGRATTCEYDAGRDDQTEEGQ